MTLPVERFNSISRTRHFLGALCDPKRTPGVPSAIRDEARRCLKHYPTALDMEEARHGLRLAAQIWAAVEPMPRRLRRPRTSDDE
jgi:hypothetical protein